MDLTSFIYIPAAAAALAIAFRVIRMAGERVDAFGRYLPVLNGVQLVLWITLVFWALHEVFGQKSYYTYLLVVLVIITAVLIAWYYLRDILAGFIFRMKHNPRLNQWMESDLRSGAVQGIGLTFITTEAADGQWYRIPYSQLVNQTVVLRTKHDYSSGEVVLRVRIPPIANPGLFEQQVRQTLVMASWCIASKPIVVKPDRDEPGTMVIAFHLFDNSYHSMAKQRIQSVVSNFDGAIEG